MRYRERRTLKKLIKLVEAILKPEYGIRTGLPAKTWQKLYEAKRPLKLSELARRLEEKE